MNMSLWLLYNGRLIVTYTPSQKQWWITGFNPSYQNVQASDLSVMFRLQFNSPGLYFAFLDEYNGTLGWAFVPQYLIALYVL